VADRSKKVRCELSATNDDSPESERDDSRRNPYAPPPEGAPLPPPRAPEPRPREEPSPRPDGRPEKSAGGGDPQRPPIEPPNMEQLKELGRSLSWFAAAMLLTFLVSQLPLPYGAATPVFGIATIVLGVRAIVRSRRISTRNLLTPMALMGIALAFMLTLAGASRIVLWPIEMEKQECMELAITDTARSGCMHEYNKGLQDRLDSLTPGS